MVLKEEEVVDYILEEWLKLEEEYLGVYLLGYFVEGFDWFCLVK